jgi:antitoxin component YwqK of YwqJK toxin-antitoxin module
MNTITEEKQQVITLYYKNGTKQCECHYDNDRELDGAFTYWYKDGTKSGEEHYKNGKRDGVWTEWNNKGLI